MIAFVLAALAQDPAAAAAPAREPAGLDLAAELARIVDLPTREQRTAAAAELARRPEVSTPREPALGLDALLDACRAFRPPAPPDAGFDQPGLHAHEVDLAAWGGSSARATFYVRLPKGHDRARRAPLLLAFHPDGSIGRAMPKAWGAVADELGMIVVAPNEVGENLGYTWSDRERDDALAALRWARRRFDVDENRIHAVGIGRGGHLAWDLALRRPDLFAAIAPILGVPSLDPARGEANARYLENVAHVPIRVLQGLKDDETRLVDLRLAFERLAAAGARDARMVEFPEFGHAFDLGAVDWAAWLGAARRDPMPRRVVRLAARADEARAFWAEIGSFGPGVAQSFEPPGDPAGDPAGAPANKSGSGTPDLAAQRRRLADEALARTARLEVELAGENRFVARAERVGSLRLWLSRELVDLGRRVEVELAGAAPGGSANASKKVAEEPIPHVGVLLSDFAERFDRAYLPVATITVDLQAHPR